MTDDSLVWDIIQFKYMILVIIIVFMNINFQRGDTLKQKTLHTLTTMGLSLDIPWFHQFLLASIFVDLEKKLQFSGYVQVHSCPRICYIEFCFH